MSDSEQEQGVHDAGQAEQHDAERSYELRSYLALAFAALLVAGAVWLVTSLRESNRIVECMTTGHHNCVPLDTSVKGPPR